MTEQTETVFWTVRQTPDDPDPVTLCEPHALEATAMALGEKFDSMAQADAILSALASMVGIEGPFDTDTPGPCQACEDAGGTS